MLRIKTYAPPPPLCSYSFRASPALNNIEIWLVQELHHSFNCNLLSLLHGIWCMGRQNVARWRIQLLCRKLAQYEHFVIAQNEFSFSLVKYLAFSKSTHLVQRLVAAENGHFWGRGSLARFLLPGACSAPVGRLCPQRRTPPPISGLPTILLIFFWAFIG